MQIQSGDELISVYEEEKYEIRLLEWTAHLFQRHCLRRREFRELSSVRESSFDSLDKAVKLKHKINGVSCDGSSPGQISADMSAFSSKKTDYLKRFRMEVDLREAALPAPELPVGYEFHPWHPAILSDHALAKFESFQEEMDSQIFPALRTFAGCRELMQSIVTHSGFIPESTWLIRQQKTDFRPAVACATIQGLASSLNVGAVQNIGVIPEHRGFGLGRALLLRNLHGFRACGFHRVYLDVSANNSAAISLYRSIGFKHIKTSYREVLPDAPVAE